MSHINNFNDSSISHQFFICSLRTQQLKIWTKHVYWGSKIKITHAHAHNGRTTQKQYLKTHCIYT